MPHSAAIATFELRAALTLAEHDLDGWRDVLSSALARFPEPEPWPEIQTRSDSSAELLLQSGVSDEPIA
jgi:hypothetical protein